MIPKKYKKELAHTVSLNGTRGAVFVNSDDWILYEKGWKSFHWTSKVHRGKTLIEYYYSKADALKAVQLRCLTQNAYNMMRRHENYPAWVEKNSSG